MKNSPELTKLVKEEAKNLKINAKQEELNRLNSGTIDSTCVSRCIYGQMTGDCFSQRAVELIKLCCKTVYNTDDKNLADTMENCKLNGSPNEKIRADYWSPIEIFIHIIDNRGKATKNLIDYLKNETETLDI